MNNLRIIEKPKKLISNWAIPGLYFYDETASQRAKSLKPSARGEIEISDLNRSYLEDGKLKVLQMPRGTAWLDLGTPGSLLEAGKFIQIVEERQGLRVGDPAEIAILMGTSEEVYRSLIMNSKLICTCSLGDKLG